MSKYERMAVEKAGAWPEVTRRIARQAWWQVCEQNVDVLLDLLNEDAEWRALAEIPEGKPGPSRRTLMYWKKQDMWSLELEQRMAEYAPAATAVAAMKLILMRADAVETLDELMRTGTARDRVRLEAVKLVLSPILDNLTEFTKPQVREVVDMDELESVRLISDPVARANALHELEQRIMDGGKRV